MVAFTEKQRESNKPLTIKHLRTSTVTQLPHISEYGNRTLYAIKSMYDDKVYDVVLDIPIAKFHKCYAAWVNGAHIQNAFPMLSADMREFIKTGITPEQWDKMFPPDEPEE